MGKRKLRIGVLQSDESDSEILCDDEALVPQVAGGDATPLQICPEPMSSLQAGRMLDSRPVYGQYLRILVMRMLVHTPAAEHFKYSFNFALDEACHFLGIAKYDAMCKKTDVGTLREALHVVLMDWEATLDQTEVLPPNLVINLEKIATVVGLNEVERRILAFTILLHAEFVLSECSELLGQEFNELMIGRYVAPILGLDPVSVRNALSENAVLRRSGLLQLNVKCRDTIKGAIDLVTDDFAGAMLQQQEDISNALLGIVSRPAVSQLVASDFSHLGRRFDIINKYLKSTVEAGSKGTNILLRGRTGLGKSTLAKVIAAELGYDLLEISATNQNGQPITPTRRLRSYRLAQDLFKTGKMILLFDECEEVFKSSAVSRENLQGESSVPMKSWINAMLEDNAIPTIWIANATQEWDPAIKSRMDVVVEMPLPTKAQRKMLLSEACGAMLSEALIERVSSSDMLTPRLIAKSAPVLGAVCAGLDDKGRDETALQWINEWVQAQGAPAIRAAEQRSLHDIPFMPDLVNCDVNLRELLDGLREHPESRLLFHGESGSGKTSCGKWLSDELGIPHLVHRASDLLSKWAGEAEQNLAQAFRRASEEKALLQIDEVDSFLCERASNQSWAISMTNEFLSQLDTYDGIIVMTTNLIDAIDRAAMRRMCVIGKFDFMEPESAWEMFKLSCKSLGVNGGIDLYESRLKQMSKLTPGDFVQTVRGARFTRQNSASKLLDSLMTATELKKGNSQSSMGFVRTA